MGKHVKDIAEKYLIPGETQTPAILFVPSESIYAELHINFSELLQRARQMQVVVVSPHVFMLVVGTIQSLMRDARMREQAHEIKRRWACCCRTSKGWASAWAICASISTSPTRISARSRFR